MTEKRDDIVQRILHPLHGDADNENADEEKRANNKLYRKRLQTLGPVVRAHRADRGRFDD